MDNFGGAIEYAPMLLAVFIFFLHNRFFVTPEQLEKKHRDIIKEVQSQFAPLVSVNELKEQFSEVKVKIDKIYDFFMKNNE